MVAPSLPPPPHDPSLPPSLPLPPPPPLPPHGPSLPPFLHLVWHCRPFTFLLLGGGESEILAQLCKHEHGVTNETVAM